MVLPPASHRAARTLCALLGEPLARRRPRVALLARFLLTPRRYPRAA
ncbi:MAG TPA: hypothetical protein VLK59_09070 [Solirubrobacteraceae bacterium]|nr:hypothetical protein [Solirubrobacteraceae bacterium]